MRAFGEVHERKLPVHLDQITSSSVEGATMLLRGVQVHTPAKLMHLRFPCALLIASMKLCGCPQNVLFTVDIHNGTQHGRRPAPA